MTANERFSYTIGFIDAVIWLGRSGYLWQDNRYVSKSLNGDSVRVLLHSKCSTD